MSAQPKIIKHLWFDINGTLALYTDEFNAAHDELRYSTYAEITGRQLDTALKAEFEKLYEEQGSNSMVFRSLGLSGDFWMNRFNRLEENFVYQPTPEIYQTLKKIKDILPISIFTNNSLVGTSKILDEINVDRDWFTFIITGDEVHERKPDLHGYRLAVEKSKLSAEQNMYIGDRVNADIRPAKTVGMQTGLVYSQSDEADYCFDTFDKILTLFS
ncbi:MAG TPA: HAD family hydrolase [Candidatus Limnocylindria bacterium]|nr:HAD family hydrolase [Candidatus Limnocylindria bacterium]